MVAEVFENSCISHFTIWVHEVGKYLAIPQLAMKSGKTLTLSSANSPLLPKNISSSAKVH